MHPGRVRIDLCLEVGVAVMLCYDTGIESARPPVRIVAPGLGGRRRCAFPRGVVIAV